MLSEIERNGEKERMCVCLAWDTIHLLLEISFLATNLHNLIRSQTVNKAIYDSFSSLWNTHSFTNLNGFQLMQFIFQVAFNGVHPVSWSSYFVPLVLIGFWICRINQWAWAVLFSFFSSSLFLHIIGFA